LTDGSPIKRSIKIKKFEKDKKNDDDDFVTSRRNKKKEMVNT